MVRSSIASLLVCAAATAASAEVPQKMRAAVLTSRSFDFKFHLEKVAVVDTDVPQPGHGQVLVQVQATNINPVDHKIVQMAGLVWSYPHKLGFDLAGKVVGVGSGCERLKVGDEVWGEATSLPVEAAVTGGTYAQYAVVSESVLGLKPSSLSMLEAGAMPMVALTGYEALSWAAGGKKFGENITVLVLGGSGGTGHVGIQLAKAMGAARIITTCSSKHADFVKSMGADEVIDYHEHNYYDVLAAKSVDVVYDCVGQSGTGDKAYPLIKEHGHFATLLLPGAPSLSSKFKRPDIHSSTPLCVGSCSHYTNIDAVSELVTKGHLKVNIDQTYSLENIVDAFNYTFAGHTTGKVAINVAAPTLEVVV
eukprot:TRINITY_DN7998_c0_g1_i2.p1 TRINITY_DN7998_c0_g1~~TRINITY_DN7998_c0_g1_i2.p1  ORF type:complete len:364 (-),score=100.27 TRINITY_DN7998_c0_g1_i2:150-1241(-)